MFRRAGAARHAPVTLFFLAACVALFAVAETHGSTEEAETLVRFGATERGHVWAGEAWRLLTAPFLHVGLIHLVWNVVGMFGWCVPVERTLGSARFAAVYLGAAVVGSAASLLAHDVVSAGASGAGFGVIGASLVLDRRRLGTWSAFAADPQVRRTLVSAAVWTLILIGVAVDHAAHLGGFAGGLALTWALTSPVEGTRSSRRLASAVAAATVVLPAVLALVPRAGATQYAEYVAQGELAEALDRKDLDAAERVLARAASLGLRSPYFEFNRAWVLEQRGDLEAAQRIYEELARSSDPEARRRGASAARNVLAWRLATGSGLAPDPVRARKLLQEACSEGEARWCSWLRENPAFGAP